MYDGEPSTIATSTSGVTSFLKNGLLHNESGCALINGESESYWLQGLRMDSKDAYDSALELDVSPSFANWLTRLSPALRTEASDAIRDSVHEVHVKALFQG
jgi:hypothetical protein